MSLVDDNATHLGEMKMQTFIDIKSLSMIVEIFSKTDKLFSYTIDFCNIEQAKRSNWVVKGFYEYFSQIYDFEIFKCPMKKGNFIYRPSRPIKVINLDLPAMFPVNKSGDVKTTLKVRKVGGGRKLEMMYETKETYMLAEA